MLEDMTLRNRELRLCSMKQKIK
ncbi:hypothetical protein AVEN_135810-1, partial [Araneus ventricosus]